MPVEATAVSRAPTEERVGVLLTTDSSTYLPMPWRLIPPRQPRSLPGQEDMEPPAVVSSRAPTEERVGPPSTPASRLRSLRMPWRLILPRPPRFMPGLQMAAGSSRPPTEEPVGPALFPASRLP